MPGSLRKFASSSRTLVKRTVLRKSRSHLVLRKRFTTAAKYDEIMPGSWHEVFPPTRSNPPPPRHHGHRYTDLTATLDPVPALGVLEMMDASVLAPPGWVVTRHGELLAELSWYGMLHSSEMRLTRNPMPQVDLVGTCLSLASDWASGNYGHFLLDSICRFELFRRAGFTLADVDHVYCPVPSPRLTGMLQRLGLSDKKLVTATKGTAIRADRVLATSFPGTRRNYQTWAVDFLRKTFLDHPAEPRRRLYVPRTTSRKVSNEQALVEIMRSYDFEVFDPAVSEDSRFAFSEAAVVVGGHGAGLADLAFCSRGSRVLELLPSDHTYPYWYTLASAAGLRYGYLIGKSAGERASGALGPSHFDFKVDEVEFEHALVDTIQG